MAKDVRQILHSAYTYVRSTELNKASASITLDALIDARIKSLQSGEVRALVDPEGNTVGTRASRSDRLDELQKSLNQLIQSIQSAGNDEMKLSTLGLLPEGTTAGDRGSED